MKKLINGWMCLILVLLMCINPTSIVAKEMDGMPEHMYSSTPIELIIKGRIFEALDDRSSNIDICDFLLSEQDACRLFHEALEENFRILQVHATPSFSIENGFVREIEVIYEDSGIALRAASSLSKDEEVQNILAYVKPYMSDMEKALVVNDYFTSNYCYDKTYSIYTKEGLFWNKTGVCSAYAAAYQYIMKDMLGIPCITVTSYEMNHAWNMIKIDGEWYHVDVTWNDPTPDRPGRAKHTYFLNSDSVISDAVHKHYGWTGGYSATGEKYRDYFWTNVETPIVVTDESYYYVNHSGLCKRNVGTGNVNVIYEIDYWPVWGHPNSYYGYKGSSVICVRDCIYFNTADKILSMDISTQKIETVLQHDTSTGYVWGLRRNGNAVEYFVSRDLFEYGIEATKTIRLSNPVGDITGDGNLNRNDLLRFGKYFAGWNVDIDESLADVTGDGKVNRTDLLRLAKYFAGWDVKLGK